MSICFIIARLTIFLLPYPTGVDDVDFSRYPDKAYQLDWIRYYLECKAEQNGKPVSSVTERDIEECYVKANKFALVIFI